MGKRSIKSNHAIDFARFTGNPFLPWYANKRLSQSFTKFTKFEFFFKSFP